jgi:pimeloyl-ACP methyl ester carboxylesterase
MARSTELDWQLDGITMHGTFTRPEEDGVFPGVVLVAGSGPTDRDWNSPLLPGTNGSARLLADALADAGVASLRYDKRASGPHLKENFPALVGRLSMASHLDELVAAVGVLAGQAAVDASRIVGLGNSEGCIHVLHYVTSSQDVPFAGIALVAPPGRPMRDVLLSQLALQLGQSPAGEHVMPLIEAAVARYSAGEPMDLDPAVPEPIRMVLSSFETPANLPFARELWLEDVAGTLSRVTVPVLVVIGQRDVQVDARADGEPLQRAAQGMDNVTFAFPEHANHVLKEDVRSDADRAAAPGAGYNEPGTRLDPEALDVIVSWLRRVLA